MTCWWQTCGEEAGKSGLCATHHAKNLRIQRTYGITLEDVLDILTLQRGKCPVCLTYLGPDDPWVIDHDHPARKVRGLLCRYCNHRVVGRHRDGDLLIRAGQYLNSPPADNVLGTEPTVPKKKRKRRAPKK